ncbi:related to GTPase-activating protein beta-chimerin [Pseudozyma flocculosa]|nr:related to GTPase-activating protein beta-chimerin [Pseudozyma flocculosa]
MVVSNSFHDASPNLALDDPGALGLEKEGELEEVYCGGCNRLLGEDSVEEGVIQFATKLWHVDCFRCAKCKNKVSTDRDDILLLSDGHPICGECNYSCNICNLPIMEEAIMTGDESYHASCFTCRACHSRIEELVFAKTNQGIYCMPCHNQRVARSRKHAEQRRANKLKEKQRLEAEEARRQAGSQDSASARMPGFMPSGEPSPAMPTISVDDGSVRQPTNTRPPSPPEKEAALPARTPGAAVQPLASQPANAFGSASSLSPYPGSAGAHDRSPRPGSANGKRPMQAPPPPVREGRGSPSPAPGQTPDRRGSPVSPTPVPSRSTDSLADGVTPSGSASSLSTAVQGHRAQPDSPSGGKSGARRAEDGSVASATAPQQNPRSALGDASGKPSSAGASPGVNGFSVDSATKSVFSSSSEYSQDTDGTQSATRANVHASPGKGRKTGLPASGSSSRLSKTYSFYDSDFIQLMDSFGRFDTNDNFQLSSPMLEEEAEAAGSSSLALPGAGKTSRAAKRMSIRPPIKADEDVVRGSMSSDDRPHERGAPSSPTNGLSDNDEEVLQDEAAAPKTGAETPSKHDRDGSGLSNLSAKMRESMQAATDGHVSMDISFVEMVLKDLDETRDKMQSLQSKYDRIKRASQQAAQGFSMAKEEFANEVNARHEAEMEMARLRRQLVDQAYKLATMSSEKRQQEKLEKRSEDVRASLKGMEADLTKLTVERDVTVAEVAELLALQDGSGGNSGASASREAKEAGVTENLAKRLDAVKARYRQEIDDLSLERDSLLIEIEELKQSRELFLEEAQSLNAKNEELNLLYSQMTRRVEQAGQARDQLPALPPLPRASKDLPPSQLQGGASNKAGTGFGFGFGKPSRHHPAGSGSIASTNESFGTTPAPPPQSSENLASIDSAVHRVIKPEKVEPPTMAKKFKLFKPKLADASKLAGGMGSSSSSSNGHSNGAQPPVPPKHAQAPAAAHVIAPGKASHDMVVREHLFQPFNVLRPTRCIACQKNMWGQSEMRCAICSQICHSKCLHNLSLSCSQPYTRPEDAAAAEAAAGPSMFGRDLAEQAGIEGREVPLVVEKCIQAVEAFGMDYEGIYRKSGGSSQLKVITQLFERGAAFDLEDVDRFNDVSAITSVLKNYFRELPVPLLTFELHEDFIRLAEAKLEAGAKAQQMVELIAKLPAPHHATLRKLVRHLHRVQQRSEENRMNARNLGVVFGPTLMKSGDPTQEFAHMGGKAMTIEYFIEHAEDLFA